MDGTQTHRMKVLHRLKLDPDKHYSLKQLSLYTNIPVAALQEVYNRGTGAWKNNIASVRLKKDFSKNPNVAAYPRSARLTKEMWSYARVYSFIDRGTTYRTTDADIAKKYQV
jgi:hypothetical protein